MSSISEIANQTIDAFWRKAQYSCNYDFVRRKARAQDDEVKILKAKRAEGGQA